MRLVKPFAPQDANSSLSQPRMAEQWKALQGQVRHPHWALLTFLSAACVARQTLLGSAGSQAKTLRMSCLAAQSQDLALR